MSWRHKHQSDSASKGFKKKTEMYFGPPSNPPRKYLITISVGQGPLTSTHGWSCMKIHRKNRADKKHRQFPRIDDLSGGRYAKLLGPKIKWRTNKRNKTGLNYFRFILYIHVGRIKQSLNNFCFFTEPSFGRRLRMQLFLKSILASWYFVCRIRFTENFGKWKL